MTAHTSEKTSDRAFDIMEEHGSVDMDDREASWREEGWAGWVPGSMDDSIAVPREQRVLPTEAQETAPAGELPRLARRDRDLPRRRVRSYLYDDL